MGTDDAASPSSAASLAATAGDAFCFRCFLELAVFFLRGGGLFHHAGAPEMDAPFAGFAASSCGLDDVGLVGDCIGKEVARSARSVSGVERTEKRSDTTCRYEGRPSNCHRPVPGAEMPYNFRQPAKGDPGRQRKCTHSEKTKHSFAGVRNAPQRADPLGHEARKPARDGENVEQSEHAPGQPRRDVGLLKTRMGHLAVCALRQPDSSLTFLA